MSGSFRFSGVPPSSCQVESRCWNKPWAEELGFWAEGLSPDSMEATVSAVVGSRPAWLAAPATRGGPIASRCRPVGLPGVSQFNVDRIGAGLACSGPLFAISNSPPDKSHCR